MGIKMKKKRYGILLVLIMTLLCACSGRQSAEGKNKYSIYYLNRDETRIEAFDYYTNTDDAMELLGELIEVMSTVPEDVNYHEPVHNFAIIGYNINDNQIALNVDEKYRELKATTEVLTRAAIVRTLTQIPGFEYVSIKIRDEELTDALGNTVGVMSADQFVDNAGNEINSYEKVKLTLFFASEDGQKLIKANRTVIYNSNISMEKLVVEHLIDGPKPASVGIYPTINSNTKIVGVTVKDRICYVNLDEGFLNQMSNATPEVTLYSLVNSLVELPNVNKVQISINGETNVVFRETYNLSTVFERNLDIQN